MKYLNLRTAIPAAALALALAAQALPAHAAVVASQGTLIAPVIDDFSGSPVSGVTVSYVGGNSGVTTGAGTYKPLFASGYTDFLFDDPIVAFGIQAAQASLTPNLAFDLNAEVLNDSTVVGDYTLTGLTQALQDFEFVNTASPAELFTEVRVSVNVGTHIPGSSALPDAGIYAGLKAAADTSLGSGTPTPEPASWALMIVGFGLTGAMLRRRQRMDPVSA
jgi:hypothetical protein